MGMKGFPEEIYCTATRYHWRVSGERKKTECLIESRMRRKENVRYGETDGRDRRVKARYVTPVPTLWDPTPIPPIVTP